MVLNRERIVSNGSSNVKVVLYNVNSVILIAVRQLASKLRANCDLYYANPFVFKLPI